MEYLNSIDSTAAGGVDHTANLRDISGGAEFPFLEFDCTPISSKGTQPSTRQSTCPSTRPSTISKDPTPSEGTQPTQVDTQVGTITTKDTTTKDTTISLVCTRCPKPRFIPTKTTKGIQLDTDVEFDAPAHKKGVNIAGLKKVYNGEEQMILKEKQRLKKDGWVYTNPEGVNAPNKEVQVLGRLFG